MAQLRQCNQTFLISADQAFHMVFQTCLFATQSLPVLSARIGVLRHLSAAVDFRLDQCPIFQQTNHLFPDNLVEVILSNGAIGTQRAIEPAVTIRANAPVVV